MKKLMIVDHSYFDVYFLDYDDKQYTNLKDWLLSNKDILLQNDIDISHCDFHLLDDKESYIKLSLIPLEEKASSEFLKFTDKLLKKKNCGLYENFKNLSQNIKNWPSFKQNSLLTKEH